MSGRQGLIATIISLFLVCGLVLLARVLVQPQTALIDGIKIEGNAAFIERTRGALNLLKSSCRDAYPDLVKNVLKIEQHERSGADVWKRCIQVGRRTSEYSLTWYASSLVHDGRHISQYNDYLNAYPNKTVPPEVYSGQDAELACMRVQIDALERMNAPAHELDWARKQDGNFADTDKDGKYDKKDYRKRDW
jgi:hypothetical protein